MEEKDKIPGVPQHDQFYPIPLGHALAQRSPKRWRQLRGPSHACEPGLSCRPLQPHLSSQLLHPQLKTGDKSTAGRKYPLVCPSPPP